MLGAPFIEYKLFLDTLEERQIAKHSRAKELTCVITGTITEVTAADPPIPNKIATARDTPNKHNPGIVKKPLIFEMPGIR
tara:strand:- start:882 stop:1121 length:240 start_codon:yes stop_codon:yes gene_type:complete